MTNLTSACRPDRAVDLDAAAAEWILSPGAVRSIARTS
jgi:hypothetical protein